MIRLLGSMTTRPPQISTRDLNHNRLSASSLSWTSSSSSYSTARRWASSSTCNGHLVCVTQIGNLIAIRHLRQIVFGFSLPSRYKLSSSIGMKVRADLFFLALHCILSVIYLRSPGHHKVRSALSLFTDL